MLDADMKKEQHHCANSAVHQQNMHLTLQTAAQQGTKVLAAAQT
jgi:hypothetical protein